MMNRDDFDPAKAGKLVQQIVEILTGEDFETRERCIQAAMALLGHNGAVMLTAPKNGSGPSSGSSDVAHSFAEFFTRDGTLKPADYAQLSAAYHYSLYGPCSFSVEKLRSLAAEAGVVIPDRVDMTMKNAQHKGKRLFQSLGKGVFKPTAAAGLFFNEKWGVKPGKQQPPVENSARGANVEH